MIQEVNNNYYKIRYADLDNSGDTVIQINKENEISFISYSFNIDDKISVFPESNTWDLLFTQYTNIFYNPTTPYLVTGVLINTSYVAVALDTVNLFSEINYEMVADYEFTQFKNYIFTCQRDNSKTRRRNY